MEAVYIDLEREQKKKIKDTLAKAGYIRLHSGESGDFYIYATHKIYVKQKDDSVDITYAYKLKNDVSSEKWIAHLHYNDARLFTLLFSRTKKVDDKERLKIKYSSDNLSELEVRGKKKDPQYGRFYYQIDSLEVNSYSFAKIISVNESVPSIEQCDYESVDHYYDWS